MTGPWTYGAVPTTPGVFRIFTVRSRQLRKTSSELTRMCASQSTTFWRSSRSNPVMTEIATMSTVTPSITPTIEISVMIETKVRFGFRYRSARKKLNGSFKVGRSVAANPTQFNRGVGLKNRSLKLGPEHAVMVADTEGNLSPLVKPREETQMNE